MANHVGHIAQGSESKIRTIAFMVLLLTLIYLARPNNWIPVFLTVDFFFRAFNLTRVSPMAIISGWITRVFHFSFKPVYLPPKRFAARIGFSFFVLILALQLSHVDALIPATIVCIFAALESIFNICVGCYVYDFLTRLRIIR